MSSNEALRQIIMLATNALAEEGSEEVEMEGEGESEDEGEMSDDEVNPAQVRATALRIRNARDAE